MDKTKQQKTETLANVLAGLDPSTLSHSQRVRKLALNLGENLALTSDELTTLSWGALLHDVGKQAVPEEILLKKTPLSVDEWEEIQKHPTYGWAYAKEAAFDAQVKDIILHHHVWYNGQGGYPASGDRVEPHPLTQITTVADVLNAITQDRPYRRALSLETALEFLQEKRGSQFSPIVVDMVLRTVDQISALIA